MLISNILRISSDQQAAHCGADTTNNCARNTSSSNGSISSSKCSCSACSCSHPHHLPPKLSNQLCPLLTSPKHTNSSAPWMRWAAHVKTTTRLSLPSRPTPPPRHPWHPHPLALHPSGLLPRCPHLRLQCRLPVRFRISKPQRLPSLLQPCLTAPRLFFRRVNALLLSE